MPCFKREKSLLFRSRRDKTNQIMAPKAVRPSAMRYHGLFGMAIAAQHLVADDKWTPNSLADQFVNMNELLSRRVIYKQHESQANRRSLHGESQLLKAQCVDGRIKLHKITYGNSAHKIRNFLINHKDMQRLYQNMSIQQIALNINQRTFVMRKERDRLQFRLDQMKRKYKQLLIDRSDLENRIRYENAFVLEEELRSRELLKKIENSSVRFRAIRIINITYKKMIQVLLQDEIFYEPILRSLDSDMEDQSNFIKHILHLGMPAISKFKELEREYRKLEEKSQKNLQAKLAILASLQRPPNNGPPQVKVEVFKSADRKHYVRETKSMQMLQRQLRYIENTIKQLQLTALCSQAKEIYPRIKGQMENNQELHRKIESDRQNHENLRCKMRFATVLEGVLFNNLSEEEINRLERIKHLKKILKADEDFEQITMDHVKNRGDAYVMIRLSLWTLAEILRHVDRSPKRFQYNYVSSYLKLPLLKFEMLNMHSIPPELYEEDLVKLMHSLKRKVYKLMKFYKKHIKAETELTKDKYHDDYLASMVLDANVRSENAHDKEVENDLVPDKPHANIPDRKHIKAQSAKVIEEANKWLD